MVLTGFNRLLRTAGSVDPGAVLWHWVLWSAVLFGTLGLLREARAADTLGDLISVMVRAPADPSRARGERPALWPIRWIAMGYLLIWHTQPGA